MLASERILILHKGRIKLEGNPRDIMKNSIILQEVGLIPPFIVRIRDKLILEGFDVSHDICTDQELVKQIWKLSSRR